MVLFAAAAAAAALIAVSVFVPFFLEMSYLVKFLQEWTGQERGFICAWAYCEAAIQVLDVSLGTKIYERPFAFLLMQQPTKVAMNNILKTTSPDSSLYPLLTLKLINLYPELLVDFRLREFSYHASVDVLDILSVSHSFYNWFLSSLGLDSKETGVCSLNMDSEAERTAWESLELAFQMSNILDTGLDRHTLSILISLCDLGLNPEALAAVVKELRRETPTTSSISTTPSAP
ncbi:hypothetical protein RJ639_039094 [Escallonia herrerae]|uniref:Uncharacterized protein n=1 Tax=Escallonia herrerae TaxID=1293975 RepID=A0AA89B3E2_9ASTE|nr:hypothetical protein RJ639_039094 [Escallonia herrerae]